MKDFSKVEVFFFSDLLTKATNSSCFLSSRAFKKRGVREEGLVLVAVARVDTSQTVLPQHLPFWAPLLAALLARSFSLLGGGPCRVFISLGGRLSSQSGLLVLQQRRDGWGIGGALEFMPLTALRS